MSDEFEEDELASFYQGIFGNGFASVTRNRRRNDRLLRVATAALDIAIDSVTDDAVDLSEAIVETAEAMVRAATAPAEEIDAAALARLRALARNGAELMARFLSPFADTRIMRGMLLEYD